MNSASQRPRRTSTFNTAWAKALCVTCACLGCAPALASCGGQRLERAIDTRWSWDGGAEAERLLAALEGKSGPPTLPAAVGVTAEGLVGRTLPAGRRWTYQGRVDVLPTIVADAVLFTGDERLTMLDLGTGRQRFSLDVRGRRLEGAGSDGQRFVLLLVDKDNAREDQLRVIDKNGNTLFQVSTAARLGTPAAVEGIGLLPYSSQYVYGFELDSGKPIGRLLYRDDLHTVQARPDAIVLLGRGATALNSELASAPASQSIRIEPQPLPGEPKWPVDGSLPRPARAEPVAIFAYPRSQQGKLGFSANTYAAAYFEILAGFDRSKNRLRWARALPRTLAGGSTGPEGVTVCLEDGSLFRVAWKDGAIAPHGSLEAKVKGCAVSAVEGAIVGAEPAALYDQVVETLGKTGPDMVAMQRVLLQAITKRGSSESTRALLTVAQDPRVSSELSREADRLLAKQRAGGEDMVRVLREAAPQVSPDSGSTAPADQSTQPAPPSIQRRRPSRPPPIGQLSKALRQLKTGGAAAALAPYLLDPSLPPKEIQKVMEAVAELGGPEQSEVVGGFLRTYKNTGGEKPLITALVLAAQFLLEHLDEEGRARLVSALNESLTHPDVRKSIQPLLTDLHQGGNSAQAPSTSVLTPTPPSDAPTPATPAKASQR